MVLGGVDEDQIHLEETVVGQKLLNSIVTKVKVDVQDTDDKYQIKKWITLQNGIVLKSEYWKEKAGEIYKSSESTIELPPHALAEQQAKKDEARAKARELLQQRKAEKEGKPREDKPKPMPKKEKTPITVYSENDPDVPTSGEPHGIWKMPEEDKDECFEPQEIVLEDDPDVADEPLPPTDDKDDQPQGIWGKDEDDDEEDSPVIVLPPGKLKLPESDDGVKFVPKGKWKPGKLNAKWPPPTKDPNNGRSVGKLKPFAKEGAAEKAPRKVGKLKLPESMQGDDWKPRRARIFPKKSENDDDNGMPKKMRPNSNDGDDDPIVGVWAPSSKDTDNWAPVDVTVYPTKSNDALDESKPCGIVAVKDDSEPNDDGTANPNDYIFCPPGVEAPDDCTPVGIWKPLPGKLNDTWPPPIRDGKPAGRFGKLKVPDCFQNNTFPPRRARVWPKSKADDTVHTGGPKKLFRPDNGVSGDLIEGIWAPSSDPDADDYEPMDVIVHPSKPNDMDESKPHGIVAIANDAKPDDDGHWKPQDFIFCPPNTDAPDGSKPIGVWTPGKLNETWPPPVDKSGGRKVGKLKVPSCFDGNDFKPRKARVFPKSNVDSQGGPKKFRPNNEGDNVTGVWGAPTGTDSSEDASWESMDVMIHPSKPDDLDESQPHGVVAIANSAQPDKDGSWDPKDIIFFPPNTKPDKDKVTPIGIWKPVPGRLSDTWPPVSPSKKRNSVLVGKLPKWQSPGDWTSCNAIVTSRKHAPEQNSDDTPRGIWKVGRENQSKRPSTAGAGSNDEDNWAPQTICMYQAGKAPAEIGRLPHGIWGTRPGADPDAFGQWKPKDLWFYPPGESPDGDDEKNFVPRGKWSYPPGKAHAKWPPSPLNKSPTRLSVPKFEYWSGSKDIAKESPSVGKLKVPGVFAKLASPTTGSPKKRSVGKLNIPKL